MLFAPLMRRDSLLDQLFAQLPQTLFELLGIAPLTAIALMLLNSSRLPFALMVFLFPLTQRTRLISVKSHFNGIIASIVCSNLPLLAVVSEYLC